MKNKKKKQKKTSVNTLEIVKTYEILRIDWYDHFSGNRSWAKREELDLKLPICTTVGMKVAEDKKSVTLAMNASTFEHLADTTTILKSCIDDVVKLGEVRYAKKA